MDATIDGIPLSESWLNDLSFREYERAYSLQLNGAHKNWAIGVGGIEGGVLSCIGSTLDVVEEWTPMIVLQLADTESP